MYNDRINYHSCVNKYIRCLARDPWLSRDKTKEFHIYSIALYMKIFLSNFFSSISVIYVRGVRYVMLDLSSHFARFRQ